MNVIFCNAKLGKNLQTLLKTNIFHPISIVFDIRRNNFVIVFSCKRQLEWEISNSAKCFEFRDEEVVIFKFGSANN